MSTETTLLKVNLTSDTACIPTRMTDGSAGYDIYASVNRVVKARGRCSVNTDLQIALPPGTYARIAGRSSLAWRYGIDVGGGVIDQDYRGEIMVILFNHTDEDYEVRIGERIAQLIIQPILTPEIVVTQDLDQTTRGSGGFGSTGKF